MPKKPRKHTTMAIKPGSGGKAANGQTRGQSEHDPKGRMGQYTAAGNSALTKK